MLYLGRSTSTIEKPLLDIIMLTRLLALFLLLLTGCSMTAPPAPITPELTEQDRQALRRQEIIRSFIEKGREALAARRLMVPKHDSAFMWFKQALDIDEQAPEAHRGMRDITATYMVLAEEAFRLGQRERAELMLSRALLISATPASVKALRDRYPEAPPAANEFRLHSKDIRARNKRAIEYLAVIAQKAFEANSRLLIVARNDAEGRWLYKQMRQAVDGYRLRGNIQIGSRPKIILIDVTP